MNHLHAIDRAVLLVSHSNDPHAAAVIESLSLLRRLVDAEVSYQEAASRLEGLRRTRGTDDPELRSVSDHELASLMRVTALRRAVASSEAQDEPAPTLPFPAAT